MLEMSLAFVPRDSFSPIPEPQKYLLPSRNCSVCDHVVLSDSTVAGSLTDAYKYFLFRIFAF